MAHIAELFAAGFRAIGARAAVIRDGLPLEDASHGVRPVVIAPHEFFPLHFLRTRPTIELEPTLAAVTVVNVEQPGSQWFEVAWEFARRAGLAVDISPTGQAEFERRGVAAMYAPLGYAPMLESAHAHVRASQRPVDVLFVGSASPRRRAFFARHADFFSSIGAEIRLSDPRRPVGVDTPGYVGGPERSELVASARIVLGVHWAESDYFEQHRALLAFANGALFVTEHGRCPEPLEPGRDFVSGRLDELPAICRHYLERPGTLDELARAGRENVRTAMPIERSCRAILEAMEQPAIVTGGAAEAERRQAMLRRIADERAREAREEPIANATTNPHYADATPAVTVLVTVFNYATFLPRCLESVASAEPVPGGIELVIVDDASTDGSAEIAERFAASASVPAQLLRKALNTGLVSARNLGFRAARAPYVFVLDADNWIAPGCLRVLHAALAGTSHAAAYGLIARVDDRTGEGTSLLSCHPWDPQRLVAEPYIDAMALFDREAVLSAGGYSSELLEHGPAGWEDYDLWLKLAAVRRSAVHVPRIVAGYRDHRASMANRFARRSVELAKYFERKFGDLVRRYPGLDSYFGFAAPAPFETEDARELRLLREHATGLERRIAELDGRIADFESSLSWRITAPLRRLGALLRRRP